MQVKIEEEEFRKLIRLLEDVGICMVGASGKFKEASFVIEEISERNFQKECDFIPNFRQMGYIKPGDGVNE